MAVVRIYSDGACRGNPGPGGWGVLLQYRDEERELYGAVDDTTNNRMELQAAIEGLKAITKPCSIEIYTDSQYVRNGITQWLSNWRMKNWKTANGKPVKNIDLWQQLDSLCQNYQDLSWHWVRGHSGHAQNERADALANKAIDEYMSRK